MLDLTNDRITQLAGLLDERSLEGWEGRFLKTAIEGLENKKARGQALSMSMIEYRVLSDLWRNHFAASPRRSNHAPE